jgi:hypothetical protein
MVGGDLIGFGEVQESINDFRDVLSQHNVFIRSESILEALLLIAQGWENRRLSDEPLIGSLEEQKEFRGGLGAHDLVRRIIRVREHPDFQALIPHLNLLNVGNPAATVPKRIDDASNKLFELFMALLVMKLGTNLRLDNPFSSKGDNPDVQINIGAREFAFACKVLNGESPKTAWERFTDGIEQLEKSDAEVGFVVISLRNIIPHQAVWPAHQVGDKLQYQAWSDLLTPMQILLNTAIDLETRILSEYTAENFTARLKDPRIVPGILTFMQSATGIEHVLVGKMLTILNGVYLINPIDGVDQNSKAVVGRLERQLHFLEDNTPEA